MTVNLYYNGYLSNLLPSSRVRGVRFKILLLDLIKKVVKRAFKYLEDGAGIQGSLYKLHVHTAA